MLKLNKNMGNDNGIDCIYQLITKSTITRKKVIVEQRVNSSGRTDSNSNRNKTTSVEHDDELEQLVNNCKLLLCRSCYPCTKGELFLVVLCLVVVFMNFLNEQEVG